MTNHENMIIKNHREVFNLFCKNKQICFQSVNVEGVLLDINKAWENFFGYNRSEVIGRHFSDFLSIDSRNCLDQKFSYFKKKGEISDVAFEIVHKNGTLLHVNLYGRINYDDHGNIISTSCILIDNTQKKQIEANLAVKEEENKALTQQLQAVLSSVPDRIHLLDPDLKIVWTNRSTNFSNQPFIRSPIGQPCYEAFHGKTSSCEDCPAKLCFQTGKSMSKERTNPDGRIWSMRSFPVFNDDGEVVQVVEMGLDITDKVEAQKKSARNAQLAAVGELSAGIAHEINNPVNGILNYAQLLKNRFPGNEEALNLADKIIKEGSKVTQIVDQVLLHSRNDDGKLRPIHVVDALSGSIELVEGNLSADGIELTLSCDDNIPLIKGNVNRLRQVFINILNNSRYALNARCVDDGYSKIINISVEKHLYEIRSEIVIRFLDYGLGISEEQLSKVMQPFYTTKSSSEGTGLGLSISQGIINEHGGELSIYSEVDNFTEVVIRLPAIHKS